MMRILFMVFGFKLLENRNEGSAERGGLDILILTGAKIGKLCVHHYNASTILGDHACKMIMAAISIHVYIVVVHSNTTPMNSNVHPSSNMEFAAIISSNIGVNIDLLCGCTIAD